MGTFLVYILKSAVCLAAFYLFYKLFLSGDTFHRFNRMTLWSLLLLSLLIPCVEITLKEPVVMQPTVLDWEAVLATASLAPTAGEQGSPLWARLMLLVYLLGGAFFLCRLLLSCIRMFRLMRRGAGRRIDGAWLILTPEAVVPFSWMRSIVMSEKDWAESGQEILTHEMAHIRNRHSVDLLLAEVCVLFYWFNPAVWLLKRELQHVHEYEADESVIRRGVDAKKYQLLLIKKAVGAQRFTAVANSFNHSSLKKRISMMLKKKSNPWARLKYLYVLPLAACTIAAFARPEISHELAKISSVALSEIIPDRPAAPVPPDTIITPKGTVVTVQPLSNRIADVAVEAAVEAAKTELEKVKVELKEEIIAKVKEELERSMPEIEKAIANVQAKREGTVVRIKTDSIRVNSFGSINGKPLILVDGKELTEGELSSIDPQTISSIEVLKDDASGLYGEKGVNGVILITKKKEE
jgi:hypothetical protein